MAGTVIRNVPDASPSLPPSESVKYKLSEIVSLPSWTYRARSVLMSAWVNWVIGVPNCIFSMLLWSNA